MDSYKITFNVDYTFSCWGVPDSALSRTINKQFDLDGEFTLPHQRKRNIPFRISPLKEDLNGLYAVLEYGEGKQLTLRLNEPADFKYEEDFEEYTDCNTDAYCGTVVLEKI